VIVLVAFVSLIQFAEMRPARADRLTDAEFESDEEIAKELANPVADLVHLPVQINYDQNIGPDDEGWRLQTNLQPVIPFDLSDDWNLITRTIVPIIRQEDIAPGSGSQSGLGDTTLSLFLSPSKPTSGGILWGAGPILFLPTATDSLLGTEKWGAGPSAIALTQRGPWTVGALGHHIWSFAGDSDRNDLSFTFLQPFLAYIWPSSWSVAIGSETNYDWKSEDWSVPINASVSSRLLRSQFEC
jgi:hypothetical protein